MYTLSQILPCACDSLWHLITSILSAWHLILPPIMCLLAACHLPTTEDSTASSTTSKQVWVSRPVSMETRQTSRAVSAYSRLQFFIIIVYHCEMQTKMTKLSTTLNAEVETGSEEKDTSEVVVSVAPGNVSFLYSTTINKITGLSSKTTTINRKSFFGI